MRKNVIEKNLNPFYEGWGFELGRVGRGIEGWYASGAGRETAREASERAAREIARKMQAAEIYEKVVDGLKKKYGGKVPLTSEQIWKIVKDTMGSIL